MTTAPNVLIPRFLNAFQGFSVKDIKEYITDQRVEIYLEKNAQSDLDITITQKRSARYFLCNHRASSLRKNTGGGNRSACGLWVKCRAVL